jgi:HAD superfamily hydrolase (TIGR01509 family)
MNPRPEWPNIETVLLDLDGTLLDLHFDNHFWLHHVPLRYADKHQLTHAEASDALMAHYTRAKGSLDWYCIDFWTRELELDIEQLKHEVADKIAIHPSVPEFLAALRNAGKRIVLVTNAHPASVKLKMHKTGLDIYFDRTINAHDIGMAKEQEGFWQKLNAIEPFSAKKTLLIDDNLEVLGCAEAYGIEYLLAVHQPDSQKGHVETRHYTAVKDFSEIMP